MKRLFGVNHEGVALGSSLVALAVSLGWFWHVRVSSSENFVRPNEVSHTADYRPSSLLLTPVVAKVWPKPIVQSSGGNWLYELFTPPTVFYDRNSASFTVSPPIDSVASSIEPLGVQLVSVEKELFRVQLAGYFGEPGAYNAVFVGGNLPSPLIARNGEKIGELGLIMRNFSVGRLAPAITEGRALDEIAATAELFDEGTGVTVMLDSRSQKLSGALIARLQSGAFEEGARAVRAGDEFFDKNYSFRVERIDAQEVLISRRKAGTASTEVTTLRLPIPAPELPDAVQLNATKPFPTRPATELVKNK